MSLKEKIWSLLPVRDHERGLVFRLFAFEFFQGAGLAILFTTAASLFVHYDAKETLAIDLTRVFIASAFLQWLTAFLYNKLEHKMPIMRLILLIMVFNALAIFFFCLFMPTHLSRFTVSALLAFFNIPYLIYNLEFWGLSSLLFDVRQSKRLFSIVSAGDAPAKIMGYMFTGILSLLGVHEEFSLWFSLLFLLISFYHYFKLRKQKEVREMARNLAHSHQTHSLHNISKMISGNSMIRKLAFISYCSFCCYLLLTFLFYSEVKDRLTEEKNLFFFFATFLVLTRILTLLFKLGATNRIMDRLGLNRSLMLAPVILLLIVIATFIFIDVEKGNNSLYIITFLFILIDIFRSALHSPVILAFMQPLPTTLRLRGHSLMKGLMDPFAFLTVGGLLFSLLQWSEIPSLTSMLALISCLLLIWIVVAYFSGKDYSASLSEALGEHAIKGKNIVITDYASINFLLNQLKGSDEDKALQILQIIAEQPVDKSPFLKAAFAHPSLEVRCRALRMTEKNHQSDNVSIISKMMDDKSNKTILPLIAHTLIHLDNHHYAGSFFHHPDAEVVREDLLYALNRGNESNRIKASEVIHDWFNSNDPQKQINALWVIGRSRSKEFNHLIASLMKHENREVKLEAYLAGAKTGEKDIINQLFHNFLEGENSAESLEALIHSGVYGTALMEKYLDEHKCDGINSRKLINVLARMETHESTEVLEKLLLKFPDKSDVLVSTLTAKGLRTKHADTAYHNAMRYHLQSAIRILHRINVIENRHLFELLKKALVLELQISRDKCLHMFEVLYDRDKIKQARMAFESNSTMAKANAMELIENTVPSEYALTFNRIFDDSSVAEKCSRLPLDRFNAFTDPAPLIQEILANEKLRYNNWTVSCALYCCPLVKDTIVANSIQPYAQSSHAVVKDTARHVLQEYYSH